MIEYENDFYGWTQEQAALLRAGHLSELDTDHLIEEIEALGRSEKRELESRLTVLLMHLLKWRCQTMRRSRGWGLTIDGQRIRLARVLSDNPGLKPLLPDLLSNAYRLAKVDAAKETGMEIKSFPFECPWTFGQIMDETFYPD